MPWSLCLGSVAHNQNRFESVRGIAAVGFVCMDLLLLLLFEISDMFHPLIFKFVWQLVPPFTSLSKH